MTVAVDAETTALMRCLQRQRDHVLGAVEGLSEVGAAGPRAALGVELPGMVQHLTLSVERLYFRAAVARDPVVIDMVGSQDSAWQVAPGLRAGDVLDRYRREASLADAVIAASSPDADLAWWPSPGVSGACTISGMSCSM